MTEPYERLRRCSYESWKTNRTHHWMPAFGDKAMAATNLGSIDETMGVSAPSQPTIHSPLAVDSDTPRSSSLMSLVRVHHCYQVPDLESRLHELIRRRSGDWTKSADSAEVLFMHMHNFMALRTRIRSVLSRSRRPGEAKLLSWTL